MRRPCSRRLAMNYLFGRSSDSPEPVAFPYGWAVQWLLFGRPYAGLQQRALLPICTAFPWPKRLQRYMIFRYGDCPADKKYEIFNEVKSLKNPKRKSIVLKDFETDFHKISCEANTTKGGSARKRDLLNCDPGE